MKMKKLLLVVALMTIFFGASATNLNYVKADSIISYRDSSRIKVHINGLTAVGFLQLFYGEGADYNKYNTIAKRFDPVNDTIFWVTIYGLIPETQYSLIIKILPGGASGYSIVYTFTTLGCPFTTTASGGGTICKGQSIVLTASGAPSYSWNTGAITTSITVSPTATTTYVVSGTDGSCKNTAQAVVTVNSLPNITVNNATICAGAIATLTASGGNAYTWSTGATTNLITVNPSLTTAYIVNGINANGCTDTAQAVVTVNSLPVVGTSGGGTICAKDQFIIDANGANTYLWNPGNISGSEITVTPTIITTYVVTGTDANGCKNTANAIVIVNPQPNITVTPTSKVICNGESVSTLASGATSYLWLPWEGLNDNTISNPVASPTTTTTYVVIGTDNNGCTNTGKTSITVNPVPDVFVPSDATICEGGSVILIVSGTSTSFTWTPATGLNNSHISNPIAKPTATTTYMVVGKNNYSCTNAGIVTVNVNAKPAITAIGDIQCKGISSVISANGGDTYIWNTGANSDSITVSPTTTTTYFVTGTDANSCTNTAQAVVTVNSLPNITATNSGPICSGNFVYLTASGGVVYSWSGGSLSDSTAYNPVGIPMVNTTYIVTGTDANGCTNSAKTIVVVNPTPHVLVNDVIICAGSSATLNASGATTYTWDNSLGNGAIKNVNPTITTIYNVTGTTGSCTNIAQAIVTVNPLPNVNTSGNANICSGSSVVISASGANTYSWNNSLGSGATKTVTPTVTILYIVTGTDINGCKAVSNLMIGVDQIPVITITNTGLQICEGESTTLSANGANSYLWSPAAGLDDPTASTVVATPTVTTIYKVTGTSMSGICSNTAKVTITITYKPIIDSIYYSNGTLIVYGVFPGKVSKITILDSIGSISYVPSFGNTQQTMASGVVLKNGNTIVVETINSNCFTTYIYISNGVIEIEGNKKLQVFPNPFSDWLNIKTEIQGKYEITLYDLLGNRVYETQSQNEKIQIPRGNLKTGLYLLKITYGNETINRKIEVR